MDLLPILVDDDEALLLLSIFGENKKMRVYHNQEKIATKFNFQKISDNFAWIHFRFYKSDIIRLKTALRIPDTIRCGKSVKVSGLDGLCILLKRMAYPGRYNDLMKYFQYTTSDLSRIVNKMLQFILREHEHLLNDTNQVWLNSASLERYANVLKLKGSPYHECFGFLDGTVRPICRPTRNQQLYYNGHRRVHSLKFQSLSLPNGLIANLSGPVHGRRHDAHVLLKSKLIQKLRRPIFKNAAGKQYHLYADPAYPASSELMTPFMAHNMNPSKLECNKRMSRIRESVEWGFGKIVRYFGFLDFKKNLKIGLQPVHRYYQVGAILTNCHTCLYGSQTSTFFDCQPPPLEVYLG